MKVVWICGLPDIVRRQAKGGVLSRRPTPAWSWILGHLPPPANIELHIVCPVIGLVEPYVEFEYMGAEWHCYAQPRFELWTGRLQSYFKIKGLIHRIRPDVVDGWGGESGCGLLATYLSHKSIVHVQGQLRMLKGNMQAHGISVPADMSLTGRVWRYFENLTYQRAYKLCTESLVSHDSLLSLYGKQSIVMKHPLREAFITHRIPDAKDDNPTFLYIGEMIARKGTMDTLHAFSKMKNRSAKLIMVGSGELDDAVDIFISKSGEGRIVHHKQCSTEEILDFMDRAHFFILPSYGDTGPTALKEALSQGLFPICYDNTGPRSLVNEYVYGELCETGSESGLQQAMDKAVLCTAELKSKSSSVVERVRRDLSRETAWKGLAMLYEEVVVA